MIKNVSICQFWDCFYIYGRLKYHLLMVLVVFYILICSFEFLRIICLDWTILDSETIDTNFSILIAKFVSFSILTCYNNSWCFWLIHTTLENEVQQCTGGLSSTLNWFTGALEGINNTLKWFTGALEGINSTLKVVHWCSRGAQ